MSTIDNSPIFYCQVAVAQVCLRGCVLIARTLEVDVIVEELFFASFGGRRLAEEGTSASSAFFRATDSRLHIENRGDRG